MTEQEKMQKQDDVLLLFKFKLRRKIIRDHEAFLLHELLRDIASISTEQGLEDPPIHETSTLRRFTEKNFADEISLFSSGRHVIVYPS